MCSEVGVIVRFREKLFSSRDLDTEERHQYWDIILCELLRFLGYGEVVDIYIKWVHRCFR